MTMASPEELATVKKGEGMKNMAERLQKTQSQEEALKTDPLPDGCRRQDGVELSHLSTLPFYHKKP